MDRKPKPKHVYTVSLGKMVPLQSVAVLYGVSRDKLMAAAFAYHIPMMLGEDGRTVYIAQAILENMATHPKFAIEPGIFDRIRITLWLAGLNIGRQGQRIGSTDGRKYNRNPRLCPLPKPYDRRVDDEIARIARLPQNERVIRATELLLRFTDAELVAGAVEKMVKGVKLMSERQRYEIRNKLETLAGIAGLGEDGAAGEI